MSAEAVIKLGVGKITLNPSPIHPGWVLEGNPMARNQLISSSADGTASTFIWDCTAGRFNWFYDVDETIYVIDGSVVIKDPAGAAQRLSAGDTIFFPAGSRAEWQVESYIRKIAFCRSPLSRPLMMFKRGVRFLKRLMGRGTAENAAAAMFQST